MKHVKLPSGTELPILGQGTWKMGENRAKRAEEIEALRTGFELGMTLIDTAEMYGYGAAEGLIAEAFPNSRKEIYIVDKVLPQNASKKGTIEACERSLRHLNSDYIDLYLLHWRGAVPLEETFEAFLLLKESGKIREYGVSNFDIRDMEEAADVKGNDGIVTNQVLYNLMRRGIEFDLLPWFEERKMPIMAYSPIEEGRLLHHPTLIKIASKYQATPAQIALAWIFLQKEMMVIPKAATAQHIKDNFAALNLKLAKEDLDELDQAFPPPSKKVPLEMI